MIRAAELKSPARKIKICMSAGSQQAESHHVQKVGEKLAEVTEAGRKKTVEREKIRGFGQEAGILRGTSNHIKYPA